MQPGGRGRRRTVLEHYEERWSSSDSAALVGRSGVRAPVLEALVDRLPSRRPLRIIDLGVGPATIPAHLLTSPAGEGVTVVGLDMAPASIPRAREVERVLSLPPRLHLVLGLMEALPFQEGVFDAAVTMATLNLVGDKAAALGEAARVIRPGGVVVVADCLRTGPPCCPSSGDAELWARCVAGAPSREELVALAEGAGLSVADEIDMTGEVRHLTASGEWDWSEFNEHGMAFTVMALAKGP